MGIILIGTPEPTFATIALGIAMVTHGIVDIGLGVADITAAAADLSTVSETLLIHTPVVILTHDATGIMLDGRSFQMPHSNIPELVDLLGFAIGAESFKDDLYKVVEGAFQETTNSEPMQTDAGAPPSTNAGSGGRGGGGGGGDDYILLPY